MSHNLREDRKYVAPCHYKTVASSNLYLPGPACLQPSFERSKYDVDMMKFYDVSSTSTPAPMPPNVVPTSTSSTLTEAYKFRGCKCGQK